MMMMMMAEQEEPGMFEHAHIPGRPCLGAPAWFKKTKPTNDRDCPDQIPTSKKPWNLLKIKLSFQKLKKILDLNCFPYIPNNFLSSLLEMPHLTQHSSIPHEPHHVIGRWLWRWCHRRLHRNLCRYWEAAKPPSSYWTPAKTNMEIGKITPLKLENYLPNLHFWGSES